jgi:putative transcriptional regulator
MKQVDWAKIDAMTDEEIEAAARSDPDNPPLTDAELAQMRRVTPRGSKKPSAAE